MPEYEVVSAAVTVPVASAQVQLAAGTARTPTYLTLVTENVTDIPALAGQLATFGIHGPQTLLVSGQTDPNARGEYLYLNDPDADPPVPASLAYQGPGPLVSGIPAGQIGRLVVGDFSFVTGESMLGQVSTDGPDGVKVAMLVTRTEQALAIAAALDTAAGVAHDDAAGQVADMLAALGATYATDQELADAVTAAIGTLATHTYVNDAVAAAVTDLTAEIAGLPDAGRLLMQGFYYDNSDPPAAVAVGSYPGWEAPIGNGTKISLDADGLDATIGFTPTTDKVRVTLEAISWGPAVVWSGDDDIDGGTGQVWYLVDRVAWEAALDPLVLGDLSTAQLTSIALFLGDNNRVTRQHELVVAGLTPGTPVDWAWVVTGAGSYVAGVLRVRVYSA